MAKLHNSTNSNKYRVLLIGLDGATFDFITPWTENGALPTLRRLMKTGIHGPLTSTIPPTTPPAWTSMLTGTNPGKHGVFHFYDLQAAPGHELIVNATYRKVPAIWNVLTEAGKRSILLNLPMTYPPEPLNGIMVTGFMTPPDAKNFTYPPSFGEQLLQRGYRVEQIFGHKHKPTPNEIRQRIENRTDIAKWLIETQDWDFFMVVYMASDGVVHRFPDNPEMIRYVYELLDSAIATLMKAAPPNTITIIASDHGIGVVHKHFMLNNWLLNKGFIRLKRSRRSHRRHSMKNLARRATALMGRVRPLQGFLHKLPFTFRRRFIRRMVPKLSEIDPSSTTAWSPASTRNFAFITLNKNAGSTKTQYDASKLREELTGITDPRTGKPVVLQVHETKSLMWGPYITSASQLVVEADEEYEISTLFTYDRAIIRYTSYPVPAHARTGIFLAAGPSISDHTPSNFNPLIWDVMPTVLHILNVPPPPGLDGRVLREIFMPDSDLARRELKPVAGPMASRRRRELTEEERQKIMERLTHLGYM